MFFQPFYSIFPKIADWETGILTIPKNEEALPMGEYGFLELFCADKKCDCRRVMIQVCLKHNSQEFPCVAVFSFGWEPKTFYRKWSKSLSDDNLK